MTTPGPADPPSTFSDAIRSCGDLLRRALTLPLPAAVDRIREYAEGWSAAQPEGEHAAAAPGELPPSTNRALVGLVSAAHDLLAALRVETDGARPVRHSPNVLSRIAVLDQALATTQLNEVSSRRCVDCEGSPHHWIEDPLPRTATDFACKHCEARGVPCPACDGDEENQVGCPLCGGDGVVQVVGRTVIAAPSAGVGDCPGCDGTGVIADEVGGTGVCERCGTNPRRADPPAPLDSLGPKVTAELVGPFETYRIVLDGFRVPFLTGRQSDGTISLNCDSRFGCDIPEEYFHSIVSFIANAMAVAAGYSCHGEHSVPLNQYKRRCTAIELVEPDAPRPPLRLVKEPE